MRLISFALTTRQFRARTKTVTRRLGRADLKPGTTLRAVEKAMGFRKGEHPVKLGPIRVVSVRRERLDAIDQEDCAREGFPELSPGGFVEMFCLHGRAKKVRPETIVTRIEFEYLEADHS